MTRSKKTSDEAQAILDAAQVMNAALKTLKFNNKVAHVYNPLEYAASLYHHYVQKTVKGKKRVIFLGMNPGPWGMAQTAVPFGHVHTVNDWLKLKGEVGRPENEHPKRPVHGQSCSRSEVSGARLWGAIRDAYKTPTRFFKEHWVANWCPLLFLEASARNFPPDKFRKDEREMLAEICDAHFARIIEILEPEWCVGVGIFAEKAAQRSVALAKVEAGREVLVGRILHPSPASPKANQGWKEQAAAELLAQEIPVTF